MAKTKMLVIRLTEDQAKILREKVLAAGFVKISEYVRITLFKGGINGR